MRNPACCQPWRELGEDETVELEGTCLMQRLFPRCRGCEHAYQLSVEWFALNDYKGALGVLPRGRA